MIRRLPALALAAAVVASPASAQTPDRSTPPTLGPAPTLTLPKVETATLSNGLRLYVVPMREVPLVQYTLSVAGGGRADGDLPGLASFTANMLDEGAGSRDAIAVAAEAAYLGASLTTASDWDRIFVSVKVPKRTLAPALDLFADVILRPRFNAADGARQRDLRLAGILQQRDQPTTMAGLAFSALLYPAAHPYHNSLGGDSASTARLDSARVRGFYQRMFSPAGATLVVTGDVSLAEVKKDVERRFAGWRPVGHSGGGAPMGRGPAVDQGSTAIYLIDKPGAPQSVIRIGAPGIERSAPDYFAVEVMNTILGGSFSSRLNSNLRETKGYTYGAGSGFQYRPLAGPFLAGASVRTEVTDSALGEFFKELDGIGSAPVADDELQRAKANLALGLAGEFETTSQMAAQVGELLEFGLPLTWYNDYVQRVMAVTKADVQRAAREHVRPNQMIVVVVGDLSKIRAGIEAMRLGPVSQVDMYGRAVGR